LLLKRTSRLCNEQPVHVPNIAIEILVTADTRRIVSDIPCSARWIVQNAAMQNGRRHIAPLANTAHAVRQRVRTVHFCCEPLCTRGYLPMPQTGRPPWYRPACSGSGPEVFA